MWDDEIGFDEPTKVYEPDAGPHSGPILLTQRIEDLEIIEIVDITPRRTPPPPPRRVHVPEPATPSLIEATPTRPGEIGYTNELLFVDVTPPAFTLDAIQDEDEEQRTTLEPAAIDLDDVPIMRPKARVGWGLKLGAVAAVLMACVSYLNGPISEPVQAGRAAFSLRSAETTTHEAKPVEEAEAKPKKKRRRARRAKAKAADGEVAVAAAEAEAEEAPVEEPEPVEEEEVSETEEELTEALAPEFNVDAARAALGAASGNASACGDGTIKGKARVSVTFAKSGNATAAVVDGSSNLAGTTVGSCIARVMRQATVPAYSGKIVTVHKRVRVK